MLEPILFLPGMMCDSRVFEPQITALSRSGPVMVAPITLGDRIEEIASEILSGAPGRFALAGIGMGGVVAMELIRRAPERVSRVALIDCNPLAETPVEAGAREAQIIAAQTGRLSDALKADIKAGYLAPGPERNAVAQRVMEMGLEAGAQTYVRQSRAMQRRRDQQGTLRRIKMPTLVMCGAMDAVVPVKRHAFMAELIPYAKLEVIENAGHMPTLETSGQVTKLLETWMSQPLVLQ